jgi:phage terminase small subunit
MHPVIEAQTGRVRLKPKRIAFIDAYMVNGRNATKAAISVGYGAKSARKAGYRMSRNVHIRAEIDRRSEKYTRTAGITAVALLEEAKRIAFSDIRQAFNADGSLKATHELSDAAAAAIASIKVQEMAGGMAVGADGAMTHVPMYTKEVKLWDKPGAIFKLLET